MTKVRPRPKPRPKRPLKKRPLKRPLKVRTVSIVPYNVPFLGANIVVVGQVVVRSPSIWTATDGDIHGAVNKTFHLDRYQTEVTAGTTFQVNVRLNLAGRFLEVRWGSGGGQWSAWSDIAWW